MGDLRAAIRDNTLEVHYQPKLNLRTARLEDVEALARWFHPKYGPIGPDRFIPLAEKHGLVLELTMCIATQAVRQCRAWIDAGLNARIAVNLSSHCLNDPGLSAKFATLLRRHDLPPDPWRLR